jgi:hypothetical protein
MRRGNAKDRLTLLSNCLANGCAGHKVSVPDWSIPPDRPRDRLDAIPNSTNPGPGASVSLDLDLKLRTRMSALRPKGCYQLATGLKLAFQLG